MKTGTEITTWEDICEAHGIDPVQSLTWADALPAKYRASQIALFRLTLLSELNWGETLPDLTKSSPEKWFPVFNGRDSSGFGFSHSGTLYDRTITFVGARLSYPTEEYSDHAANTFLPWYRDLMVRTE